MPHAIASLLPTLAWTFLCSILLTIGDITFRHWQHTAFQYGFWATFVLYALAMLALMLSFFGQNIAIASIAAILLNTISYLIVARLAYGDDINAIQLLGIGLAFVAITLFETAAL
jgi:hypothetical protein